jgi:hypothetical protein
MSAPTSKPTNWWHILLGLIALFFLWAIAFIAVFIEEMAMYLLVKPSQWVFGLVGDAVVKVRRWM